MNNTNILYTVKWTQPYALAHTTTDFRKVDGKLIEYQLLTSVEQFPEAMEVINLIKNKR